jgi:hypothetical protein
MVGPFLLVKYSYKSFVKSKFIRTFVKNKHDV